jgi:hypothetical protein
VAVFNQAGAVSSWAYACSSGSALRYERRGEDNEGADRDETLDYSVIDQGRVLYENDLLMSATI